MGRDTNFYYSFLVLPREKRQAIVSVWDFCRAVDDAVDEAAGASGAEIGRVLDGWRDEVRRTFGGASPQTAEGRALQPWTARFGLPREQFEALIDGVAMDVGRPRYRTFDELREYCHRVASTVGLICLEIFGYRDARSREYAVELGLALQLTNILRDVGKDLERGRLYLPLDELEQFGCTEADLARGQLTPPVVALLRHQAERAHRYYDRARSALPRQDAGRLAAAEIMGAIYRAILDRIESRNYDVFSEVVRVGRPRRAAIAAATWLRVWAGAL